jgi:hypothetical protein
MTSTSAVFRPSEIVSAIILALVIECAFFATLVLAGKNATQIKAKQEAPPEAVPMKVLPVLDDLPLLKQGGKKVRPKLPEMWKKLAPVQRFEQKSAPSSKAAKTPDAIPTSPLAKADAEAPPPDAEVAKEVDQPLLDAAPEAEPPVEGEGAPDGVKEGTETDPLKANAVSLYRSRILAWFNARFRPPVGELPCEELKKSSASFVVSVGGDRSVASVNMVRPSGNAVFDGRAKSTMDGTVGQELPPPPELYPDILGSTVSVTLSGKGAKCD